MSDSRLSALVRTMETARGTVQFRPASPDDVPAFTTMRLHALQTHPEAFGSTYEDSLQRPPEFWEQRLTATTHNIMFLAVGPAGELAGMTGIFRDEGTKLQHNATVVSVYIDPAWRGLRLVDTLLDLCLDWARLYEVRIVRLAVAGTNTPAMRTYIRCGFSVYGIDPEVIHVDGVYYDELLMYRRV